MALFGFGQFDSRSSRTFDVLSSAGRVELPFQQRQYQWTKAITQRFIGDMLDSFGSFNRYEEARNSQDMFLGTFVFHVPHVENRREAINLIYDGQQRYTTISLVLLACVRFIRTFPTVVPLGQQYFNELARLARDVLGRVSSEVLMDDERLPRSIPRLNLQPADKQSYDSIYKYSFGYDIYRFPVNKPAKSLLLANFDLITKSIQEHMRANNEPNVPNAVLHFMKWIETQSGCLLVTTVSSRSAAMVFGAVNTPGLALGNVDVFKARLWEHWREQCGEQNIGVLDQYWSRWTAEYNANGLSTSFSTSIIKSFSLFTKFAARLNYITVSIAPSLNSKNYHKMNIDRFQAMWTFMGTFADNTTHSTVRLRRNEALLGGLIEPALQVLRMIETGMLQVNDENYPTHAAAQSLKRTLFFLKESGLSDWYDVVVDIMAWATLRGKIGSFLDPSMDPSMTMLSMLQVTHAHLANLAFELERLVACYALFDNVSKANGDALFDAICGIDDPAEWSVHVSVERATYLERETESTAQAGFPGLKMRLHSLSYHTDRVSKFNIDSGGAFVLISSSLSLCTHHRT